MKRLPSAIVKNLRVNAMVPYAVESPTYQRRVIEEIAGFMIIPLQRRDEMLARNIYHKGGERPVPALERFRIALNLRGSGLAGGAYGSINQTVNFISM